MEPIGAFLRKKGLLEHSQARILIHVFSNGTLVNSWVIVVIELTTR